MGQRIRGSVGGTGSGIGSGTGSVGGTGSIGGSVSGSVGGTGSVGGIGGSVAR